MNFFAFIFSFYLLALSLMPCTDKEDCKHLSEQTTPTFATTDHSDHHEDTENCPPFCVCACCGQTFSSEFFYTEVPNSFNIASLQFPAYTSSFISDVFCNIWQPPKIS